MSGGTLAALELALILVAVVGWGLWELHKLKKDR